MKSKDLIKNIIYLGSNVVPSSVLFKLSKRSIFPTYRVVTDNYLPHVTNLFTPKTSNQFIRDLDFLLKYFKPLELPALIDVIHNRKKLNGNYFYLSFDDGLRECYDIIAPILRQKGIPATFFVNPAFINNKDMMHRYKISLMIEDLKRSEDKRIQVQQLIKKKLGVKRDAATFLLTLRYPHKRFTDEVAQITGTDFQDYLKNKKPYLSTAQINEMIAKGFTFGAHSMDHPEYFLISEEEQLKQTTDSIEYTVAELKAAYRTFAFPFTDKGVSRSFFHTLLKATPPLADLSFGVAGIKKDIHAHHLQRIPMEKKVSGDEILKGEYLYYFFKKMTGKNRIKRR